MWKTPVSTLSIRGDRRRERPPFYRCRRDWELAIRCVSKHTAIAVDELLRRAERSVMCFFDVVEELE